LRVGNVITVSVETVKLVNALAQAVRIEDWLGEVVEDWMGEVVEAKEE
jgi:hypothetical protein